MKPALLVIDLQVQLVAAAGDGDAVIARVAGLVECAHDAAVPVLFIQHDDTGPWLVPETPGWQIEPRLGRRAGDPVIRKRACDAFYGTSLGLELTGRKIDRLVICGMQTEFCVDTTVRRAIGEHYPVTLVADGHTTLDNAVLPAAQIVRHHNATLDGFGTEDAVVTLAPAAEIRFGA
jgi:nicotinamidase-related amidase